MELWPHREPNRAALSAERSLPFPNALFDRVLVIHGLEESEAPAALLAEARRVLAPSGRLIAAVASRHGLWSRADATPFGHGRPFTRTQLEAAVLHLAGNAREAMQQTFAGRPKGVRAPVRLRVQPVGAPVPARDALRDAAKAP